MNKNLSKIYTILVIISLLLLASWSSFDIYRLRSDNSNSSLLKMDKIKRAVEEQYNDGISFDDADFLNRVKAIFLENKNLEILTIYSEGRGIEYFYNKGEEVKLLNKDDENPLSWESLPEYKYNKIMKTKLNSELTTSDRTGLTMDLIYQVVERATIYKKLILILIVVAVLFFLTLIMIFLVSRKPSSPKKVKAKKQKQIKVKSSSKKKKETHDDESEDDLSLDWGNDQEVNSVSDDFSLGAEDDFSFDENPSDLSLDNNDLDLGDDSMDFSLSDDEFNIESSGDDLIIENSSDDFNIGDPVEDFSLDEPLEDFNLGDSDTNEFQISETPDDTNIDTQIDDFNLEENGDDFALDNNELDTEISIDDIETDFPAEEDLLAMDHELGDKPESDDFSFDDMDESFSDNPNSTKIDQVSSQLETQWQDFIEEKVNLELEKAVVSKQDMIVGVMESDGLTDDNATSFSQQLEQEFSNSDIKSEFKNGHLVMTLQNTDLDKALQSLESFTANALAEYGEVKVGISSRNNRNLTGNRIFMEAENAMYKAIEDSEKNIVGFRSDPEKFKDFLANK